MLVRKNMDSVTCEGCKLPRIRALGSKVLETGHFTPEYGKRVCGLPRSWALPWSWGRAVELTQPSHPRSILGPDTIYFTGALREVGGTENWSRLAVVV